MGLVEKAEAICEKCRAECGKIYWLLEKPPATQAGDAIRLRYDNAQETLRRAYKARPSFCLFSKLPKYMMR